MATGKFVVFSGGDGSGKTTALERLKDEFPQLITSREPGGTPVGQRIRGILLDDATLDPDVTTELYLFTADRSEHITRVVRPALSEGRTIISDRHWMDTFAYQWFATMRQTSRTEFTVRCIDPKWPKPDLWVWFDIEPFVGLQRRRGTAEQNRIDNRNLPFHDRVRDGYKLVYSWYPDPKVRIDASQSIDDVYASVKAALASILEP